MQGKEQMDEDSRQNLPSYFGLRKVIFLAIFMESKHRKTKPVEGGDKTK